jgi:hypothetical protein
MAIRYLRLATASFPFDLTCRLAQRTAAQHVPVPSCDGYEGLRTNELERF